ncbi:MAG: sulfite exporter TauE/SafE family protein [Paracoccaceae bacterium]|nr:sulfite exporter TauE/SafE family protein [Paracoccaceae bacterium]
MEWITQIMPLGIFGLACLVTMMGGYVKGAVGFAMPLVMISGMGIFLDPQIVVAGIVIPVVLTNVLQVVRGGWSEAWSALREHRLFIVIVSVVIFAAAQALPRISTDRMLVVLGAAVMVLCLVQLAGWRPNLSARMRRPFSIVAGVIAGVLGGLSGTWGAPTVLYLLALETPKARAMSIQGVIFGLGSWMLLFGHLQSGVLRAETAPFSLALVAPALLGMMLGFKLGDRMDQEKFRTATLWILVIAGLNLIRRGAFG